MNRHYYAAHSYMGLNYTYDSPCWELFCFDTMSERDEWISEHEYNDQGNLVAEAVSLKIARKICPWLTKHNPHDDQTGYYTFNTGREVIHL